MKRHYIFIILPLLAMVLMASCSKNELNIQDTGTGSNKNDLVLKSINSGTADASFTAFNNTFLHWTGNTAFYQRALYDQVAEGGWVGALEILALEDVYERTNDSNHKKLINDMCNTFLANNAPSSWPYNNWNDDIGWMTLALIRAYQITGTQNFLTQARYGFDMAWARGWDTQYNDGGIWQVQPVAGPNPHKDPLANNSLGKVACYIYQSNGDKWYLDRANDLYNWAWHHIYDPSTGLVYEKLFTNGTISYAGQAYNQGTWADFGYLMFKITGNTSYRDDAIKAIDYTRNNLTNVGIFSKLDGYVYTWADEIGRALGHICRSNPYLWDKYWGWMKQNANGAWDNRRTDLNISWNAWDTKTPNDVVGTIKFVSALVWLQYTPETKPTSSVSIANGTYKIISRQNGYALDAVGNGTGNNTALDVWPYNGGNNQKWTLTSLGGGMYKIIGVGSGRSIDVGGASTSNGAGVILYDYQNSYNQNIYLSSPSSGYYTITFVHSGMALDVNGANNSVDQWPFTAGNNQQWQFQAP